jgi:hypothetical protein
MSLESLSNLQKTAVERLDDRLSRVLEVATHIHEGLGLTPKESMQVVGIVLWNHLVTFTASMYGIYCPDKIKFMHQDLDKHMEELLESLKQAPSNN